MTYDLNITVWFDAQRVSQPASSLNAENRETDLHLCWFRQYSSREAYLCSYTLTTVQDPRDTLALCQWFNFPACSLSSADLLLTSASCDRVGRGRGRGRGGAGRGGAGGARVQIGVVSVFQGASCDPSVLHPAWTL